MTDERTWYQRIGAHLRHQRGERGWTLYDVAAVTGTTANAVSMWERGLHRMKAYHYVLLQREGLLP